MVCCVRSFPTLSEKENLEMKNPKSEQKSQQDLESTAPNSSKNSTVVPGTSETNSSSKNTAKTHIEDTCSNNGETVTTFDQVRIFWEETFSMESPKLPSTNPELSPPNPSNCWTWPKTEELCKEDTNETPLEKAKRLLEEGATCELSPELRSKWGITTPISKENTLLTPPSPKDNQIPLRDFRDRHPESYTNSFGDYCEQTDLEGERVQVDLFESHETQELNKDQKRNLLFKKNSVHRAGLLSLSPFKQDRILAEKLHSCSQKVYQFHDGGKAIWRCKSRFCHTCQNIKRTKLTKIFEQNLIMNSYSPKDYYFITLTLPALTLRSEASKHIKLLNKNFAKLARRKAWRESVDGYIKVIEFTQKGEFINPHIHLLVAGNESLRFNKLFQRRTDKSGKPYFKLGYVWGNYFKDLRHQEYAYVDVKTVKPRRGRTEKEIMDLNWIPVDQITPNELSTDVLGYMLKPETRDPNLEIDDFATEQTTELIQGLKNSRLISTSGSLLGFLSAPPKPKLTEEERQLIVDRFRSENIKGRYEYNIHSRRYSKTDQFSFSSFGLLQLRTLYSQKRNKPRCESSPPSPRLDICYESPRNPLRVSKDLTPQKDE